MLPPALQVVISGALDEDRLLPRLESLLAGLPAGTPQARPVLPPAHPSCWAKHPVPMVSGVR